MTDATPTQPTGSGKRTWRIEMARDEVDMAQFARFEVRPIMPSPERDMVTTVEELDA